MYLNQKLFFSLILAFSISHCFSNTITCPNSAEASKVLKERLQSIYPTKNGYKIIVASFYYNQNSKNSKAIKVDTDCSAQDILASSLQQNAPLTDTKNIFIQAGEEQINPNNEKNKVCSNKFAYKLCRPNGEINLYHTTISCDKDGKDCN